MTRRAPRDLERERAEMHSRPPAPPPTQIAVPAKSNSPKSLIHDGNLGWTITTLAEILGRNVFSSCVPAPSGMELHLDYGVRIVQPEPGVAEILIMRGADVELRSNRITDLRALLHEISISMIHRISSQVLYKGHSPEGNIQAAPADPSPVDVEGDTFLYFDEPEPAEDSWL